MTSYKELIVWQKAVDVCAETYRMTDVYPRSELYGLTQQTRKSAVSIASNIAEGWSRRHTTEYLQFLNIALGSAAELETQLIIGNRLSFLLKSEFENAVLKVNEIMKMLTVLQSRLRAKHSRP